ncbi:hypothetical protein ARC78_15585 [Stenotrophomonas pictorum JCM 9942]|uniref:Uncharacterized protein n=1 Tax=Stenotrophomonas pictorum JCM 9942 TaxID=1236960 RepID=A0A0R0A8Y7_9GAMM|nr:hypothetical protein [Stenotrophomonas pictorum]KRG38554.1 hypothetical protein ARC78_15585 [Stenotrophomonas pictorum JCM 9942]
MDAVGQQQATPSQVQTPSCIVPCPNMIYARPRNRAEFDAISLPATVHDWKADATKTLIESDGRKWESRCTSKCLDHDGVLVFFQWVDYRHAEVDAHTGGAA